MVNMIYPNYSNKSRTLMTNQSFSNDLYAHLASVIQNPPHFLLPWNRFTKPSPFLTSAGAQRALSIKVQLELFFITVFFKDRYFCWKAFWLDDLWWYCFEDPSWFNLMKTERIWKIMTTLSTQIIKISEKNFYLHVS